MKTFLEVSLTATEGQREMLIPTMVELGCIGFQETDAFLHCFFNRSDWTNEHCDSVKAELKKLLNTISANAAIEFREFPDENWNEQWERTIQPIEIGTRLVIKPSWSQYSNTSDRIIIQIDPKMSFGTGYHETTRLTLRLLEKHLKPGWSVLDVGTGTGVLAIAAIKLGAAHATGIDIDEWSIHNATENILLNGVQSDVTISSEPLEDLTNCRFDLLCANLTLNTNIAYLERFRGLVTKKGLILFSGLLLHDRVQMIEALSANGFALLDELIENEWIALTARGT